MWDEIPYVNSQPTDLNTSGPQSGASDSPKGFASSATDLLSQLLSYHIASDQQAQNNALNNAGANVRQLQGAQPAPGALPTGKIVLALVAVVAFAFAMKKLA